MAEYDRNKDKELFKDGFNVNKERGERWINVIAYSYDEGEKKVRIQVSNKNSNANADSNKKWINQKGITSLTKPEVEKLIKALEKAVTKL